ncbi:putative M18 family aminopeptidase 2 [Pseudoclavibacter endophyticus]|uniref:M18 family aminopeptidase n=1 Tax=Pseudoclavibacter endophyticus TaxID=1778590 RepID=A0A6H9WGH7_9MICO|nr:M18 family aminopeptidase [Pseudoclavibacter endophyticus]KAB1650059.1 M18 family aminopeptidase [Pseudoclavibacter endophyticus]GGA57598.1 putative M18 family aminopeptidase 2 [Pseudoclavibacter endophyticus]
MAAARRRNSHVQRQRACADSLAEFVERSPSSFHAAAAVADHLASAGFARVEERDEWPAEPGDYVLLRDGAVVAWRIPEEIDDTAPFAIVGAHTDSPGFRLKPSPDRVAHGWRQLAVEVYGGPLLNSWLDRELRLAGRVSLTDGSTRLVQTGAIARIPQLAVHLDRQVNSEGLKLDPQLHTAPVTGPENGPDARSIIAAAAGVEAEDLVAWDLALADTQAPAFLGSDETMLAAGRLDNLVSVHAAMRAIVDTVPSGVIPVIAAFDHEEVGSGTRSGAAGPLLEQVIDRIQDARAVSPSHRARALGASWCVSSDVGHSIHPNYPERHDDGARPIAGGGPILKVNANQRYASDARGAALWAGVCSNAGVTTQPFVSRNSIPCGSTIGPITATRLGVSTVDVGIPILSMHSAREVCAIADAHALERALAVFLAGGWPEHA